MYLLYDTQGSIKQIHGSKITIPSTATWVFYSGDITGKKVDVETKQVVDGVVPQFNDYFQKIAVWKDVRDIRTRLLAETDWVVTKQVEQLGGVTEQWKEYRQQLRDITLQADPFNIVWPEKPSTT